MFPSHQRFHGNSEDARGALGFDEMCTNAVVLDAPLMVCHNNHYDWREIGQKLHIARGQGVVVDISIFDAEKVQDNSTFNTGEHGLPTTGIPYVTVSGKIIVKDTLFQYDTFTGRLIRFPVEEKGPLRTLVDQSVVQGVLDQRAGRPCPCG